MCLPLKKRATLIASTTGTLNRTPDHVGLSIVTGGCASCRPWRTIYFETSFVRLWPLRMKMHVDRVTDGVCLWLYVFQSPSSDGPVETVRGPLTVFP